MADSYIASRIQNELDGLGRDTRRRSLSEIRGVNLCSNDYLALSDDPQLKSAVVRAVAEAGSVSSTGSRLLSGRCAEWQEIEPEIEPDSWSEEGQGFRSGH